MARLVPLATALAASLLATPLAGCPSDAPAPLPGATDADSAALDRMGGDPGDVHDDGHSRSTLDNLLATDADAEPRRVLPNALVAKAAGGGVDCAALLNPGRAAAALAGWALRDDGGHAWAFPEGALLPAQGFAIWAESEFGFGLGKADGLALVDPAGAVVDEVAWVDGDAPEGASWGRLPDATGPFSTLAPTPGAPNLAPAPR